MRGRDRHGCEECAGRVAGAGARGHEGPPFPSFPVWKQSLAPIPIDGYTHDSRPIEDRGSPPF